MSERKGTDPQNGDQIPKFVVFRTISTIRDEKSAAKIHYIKNCQRKLPFEWYQYIGMGSVPLISERKGTDPHWKHVRCTLFAFAFDCSSNCQIHTQTVQMRYYVSWKTTGCYRKDSLKLAARCPVSGCWPSCWELLPITEFCQLQNWLCVQVLRSPILATLLHGTRAGAVSQTLWRGTRNRITELSQRAPPIFGWAAIMLGIGPHSSCF